MNHFHSFLLTAAAAAAPVLATAALPVPVNVAAVASGNDVTVTWQAPAVPGPTVTAESFEDYPSYAIDNIGDWTMVDADGLNSNGWYDVADYDADLMAKVHYSEPYAWQVLSNELFTSQKFSPADGEKALASFASFGGTSDNWAISPRLSGEAQTISFRGLALPAFGNTFIETVEILYSTTGNATGDFTLLATETGFGNSWSNFSYNLPAGATYFALRYITGEERAFGVAIDQVRFCKDGDGSPELVGFNVYRDGEKHNPNTLMATRYVAAGAAGMSASYAVSAVFTTGESELSEPASYVYIPESDVNLTVEAFDCPAALVPGKAATFTVKVKNNGRLEATAYDVRLLHDGKEVTTVAGTPLASLATADIELTLTPTNFFPAENAFAAEVVIDGDESADDNRSETVTLPLTPTALPAPVNFAGEAVDGDIRLTWEAPEVPAPTVTVDSFEDYTSYAIDNIGDWTMVDADGLNSNGWYDVPDYDSDLMAQVGYNEPYAWQVLSNELFTSQKFSPDNGEKALASFASFGGTSDNWAISPRLSGEAQTISFRGVALAAFGDTFPETVEILYSTTGNATDDFTLLATETGFGNSWSNFSFNLPAGATYFALRYVTGETKAFGVAIDQVSFCKEGDGSPELVGFNVYRDGEKLNPKTVFALSHTDKDGAGASHEYHATALYTQGESVLSDRFYHKYNGIDTPEASDIRVIASRGVITVTGAAGLRVTVCGTDGRVAASVEASDNTSVSVSTGIYVVTVGNHTVKVAVR